MVIVYGYGSSRAFELFLASKVYEGEKQWPWRTITTTKRKRSSIGASDGPFLTDRKRDLTWAHECIDRHPPDAPAIRIKFTDGRTEIYTFGQFSGYTRGFARYLETRGVAFGDKVAMLLFPTIELYTAMMGTFRRGARPSSRLSC